MTKQHLAMHILVALYRTASLGQFPSESRLSELIGADRAALSELLQKLDHEGLLDRTQLRLTLPGLALAVAATRKTKIRALARAA
jgi:DNA-binding IclR family transcriptional regulator